MKGPLGLCCAAPGPRPAHETIHPAFQFEDHKPIAAVRAVLEAFGKRKAPWKLALWFTSNNGWLPDNARSVDLRVSDLQAVVEAALR